VGERKRIDDFLDEKRIALIGASTNPEAFSRYAMKALVEHGIRVVPVHPTAAEIAGEKAFTSIGDVEPNVERR
jgi:predicted CoA-binding protein